MTTIQIGSALMVEKVENPFSYSSFTSDDRSVFIDEKHAKSALAMAMISQLIPFYGGEITDEEWLNTKINKWCIEKRREVSGPFYEDNKMIYFDFHITNNLQFWNLLAFHTEELAKEFLKNNRELCEQFYMMK